MRSPWKVIAGLVSRRDSQAFHAAVAKELPTAPDTKAEKQSGDAATSDQIVAFKSTTSRQHINEIRVALEDAPPVGLGQPGIWESTTAGGGADVEPALATTIRLVTADRLSVLASVPDSTTALDAPETGDPYASAEEKNDLGETATAYSDNAAETAGTPENAAAPSKSQETNRRRAKRTAVVMGRPGSIPVRRATAQAKVDASTDDVVAVSNLITEIVNLNVEVAQLRYQLAQKLRLQNDQLKQLLARYDAR